MHDHGSDGDGRAAHEAGPRVLFVTQHLPVPVRGGSSQRSNLLIEALGSFAQVDILAIGPPGVRELLERHGYRVAGVVPANAGGIAARAAAALGVLFPGRFRYRPVARQARALSSLWASGRYDVVIGRYCRTSAQAGVHTIPGAMIDVDDLESQKLSSWLGNHRIFRHAGGIGQLLVHRVRAAELRVIGALRRVWFSAMEDLPAQGAPRADVVPNIPFYPAADLTPSSARGAILFVASFDYRVNADALRRLIDNVWPRIRHAAPHLILRIVGGGVDASARAAMSTCAGVEYAGFVDDLAVEYDRALCAIVPIWEGGGTKIKILESLALGRTCVVAAPSLRGFGEHLRDGRELVVAKDEGAFAAAVVRLAADDALRHRLEEAGRVAVRRHFSRAMLADRVRHSVDMAIKAA